MQILYLLPALFGFFVLSYLIKARGHIAGSATGASVRRNAIRLAKDQRGQDLIEYALLAGFVVFMAGAVVPGTVKFLVNLAVVTDIETARLVCGAFAVVFLGVILLRRRAKEYDG